MWRFRSLAPRLGRCGLDFATLQAPLGAPGALYIREHHWFPAGGGLWGYA